MHELAFKNPLIDNCLSSFRHPTLKKGLIELGAVNRCNLDNGRLYIHLKMPFAWQTPFEKLQQECSSELIQVAPARGIRWSIDYDIATMKRHNQQTAIKNVKNIIAISSGKGGVGKSSTAVNVALALQKEGAKVGLLDADIYGPSIPTMLGAANERPLSPDGKHMQPIMAYGLATNSIGYLVESDDALIWRGPMASKALLQILQDTMWPDLDYLIIDMPPGTGDIQLTLAQNIPVTAAVIVTTPQDIALIDAQKGIEMFNRVNVPVIGIIENMSYHMCSRCGHREAIFGENGAQTLVKQYQTPLLGQIPLHMRLRQDLDSGKPTVETMPDSQFTSQYRDIADLMVSSLYWQGEVALPDISIRLV